MAMKELYIKLVDVAKVVLRDSFVVSSVSIV